MRLMVEEIADDHGPEFLGQRFDSFVNEMFDILPHRIGVFYSIFDKR